jgi:hypothetical protein
MQITFTQHALAMLTERGIAEEWVRRTLAEPDDSAPDPSHPDRHRAFRAIAERDGRVLRVVYSDATAERRVITAFFDRGRR